MNKKELKLFEEAIKNGILKGIEKVGVENVDWFSIKLQNFETGSTDLRNIK